MSSWFSDLAGKAENILNKIDQNAASVLKNDLNDRDQLIEVKTDIENGNPPIDKIVKRSSMANSLKLSKSPRKVLYVSTERIPQIDIINDSIKSDSKLLNSNSDDGTKLLLPSNASNSSRRSSCSSRTEGIQTVFEYPITKVDVPSNMRGNGGGEQAMQTSTSSLGSMHGSLTDEKTEMMAMKIVLAQMKVERDQMRAEIDELKNQLVLAQKDDILSELTATCDQLATDKENLQRKLQEIDDSNNGYVKTNSQLQMSIAKMHEAQVDLSERFSLAQTETEQAVFELQQYRSRAQHTLQMKDALIAELKSMHTKNESADIDTDIDAQCKQIEYVTLKQERDSFLDEINTLRNQLNANKQIIASLESKLHDFEQQHNENEKSLNGAIKQEKLKYSQLEETARVQAKEMKVVRDELKRQQSLTSIKLHEQYDLFHLHFFF